MKTLLAWLKLLRLPNHATVVADILAGFLIASQARVLAVPPAPFWWAVAAGVLMYAAGMVLNDVFDIALDRQERPERPLPSGAIDIVTAAAVGQRLLGFGGVCACVAAFISGHAAVALVGAALTAAIWIYDRHAKATAFGPTVMGCCRALSWLLGMTAAGGPAAHEWLIPLGMGMYAGGITLYARDEAGRSRREDLAIATGVMLAGLAVAGAHTWLMASAGGGAAWLRGERLTAWLVLWGLLAGSILVRNLLGIIDPEGGRVRQAVGNAIMSIITLDAVLVLAACGEPWAIVVLALLAPFLFGRQFIPPT